jgi:hypothetical protein
MADFADVEEFAREHGRCGGITPSAAPDPGGGFQLTLTCACGAALIRPVTVEEARRPLPLPRALLRPGSASAPPAPPPPSPPPQAPPPPSVPDLAASLRAALDADDARGTEHRGAAAPTTSAGDAADAVVGEAEPKRVAPLTPSPTPPVMRLRPPVPKKPNVETTSPTAPSQPATLVGPARRRTRVVWLVLFALVGVGAAVTVYFAGIPDEPAPFSIVRPPAPSPVVRPPAPPPGDQQQRAALEEIMKSLRQLQAASSLNTPLSEYSSRVGTAGTDLERLIGATAPGPARVTVREVLDIHVLAAAAWKARTVDQKESWEAVGQDPAIDLCPSVKRAADFTLRSQDASRAQARGAAVASAIPLLWECAAAKIAAIDQVRAAE